MPDISSIFIPRRVSNTLRGIYLRKITVISAPDGTGKSTLLREFTRRTRPDGISLRFIRSAQTTVDCFAQISRLITGEALEEPLTDMELSALREKFSSAAPEKPLVIIVDCAAAAQTLFGNLRTAMLLSECVCARFVFVCSGLKPRFRTLAQKMDFLLIERDQLCMDIGETAEYTARCGSAADPLEIYTASRGAFLGARLCLILAQQGKSFLNSTTESRLIRAAIQPSLQIQGALIAAATYPTLSEQFCRDLQSFSTITNFFGEDLFTSERILKEMQKLCSIIPLAEINLRSREIHIHPVLKHAAYTIFFTFPEKVQHDMRICFAREYQRNGQYYFSFCEYFLAGEYELSAGVRARDRISYSMLMKSSRILQRFVLECPLDCKPAIPRIMRFTALLMHTDAKPAIAGKFQEIIAHISSSTKYDASEKRALICYAHALRTNEDFYVLDKMGSSIKRAYDLFKNRRSYDSPVFPWTMYSPSVFCLLHRRGYSLHTENEQFKRYQKMYTEMLGHGQYTQLVFTGEMKYYQGDLSSGLELLTAAASLCTSDENTATRISALFSAAKCCLYLGEYKRFFEIVGEILDIQRAEIGNEEGDCAKLCLGLLRSLQGGANYDMWYALSSEENDVIYNRYTAPYYIMTKAAWLLMEGKNEQLTADCEGFIATAAAAGNEPAGITLRLYCAQSYLFIGDHEAAIRLFSEALNSAVENHTLTALAEFCALYPDIFNQLYMLVSDTLRSVIDSAQQLGAQFRRGIETVRTYEMTYLFNTRRGTYSEHYIIPLERLMNTTDELRKSLGLSKAAYSYAIMAASGITNAEISTLFGVSENSVKSSLKRTFAALGVKNRRDLTEIIPTLK